jgi:hypothetical protein
VPRPNIREQPVQGNELLPAAPKHHGPAAWTRMRTGRNFITATMCIHVIGAGQEGPLCPAAACPARTIRPGWASSRLRNP